MLFPTIEFAIFFAVVFPITWLLNDRNTAKKWFLVAASYYFYASWRVEFTLLLLASSVGNYLAALLIGRLGDGWPRRLALSLAVDARVFTIGASHGGQAMRPLMHHTARVDRLAHDVSAGAR